MLRDFLEIVGTLCTENEDLGLRISKSVLLDYDYELNNPKSVFSFKDSDRKNPLDRMKHLFAFKHLKDVDTKKAERCELLVNLLALYSYKNKYETTEYDNDISLMTTQVEEEPIPEIDEALPMDVVVMGYWSA